MANMITLPLSDAAYDAVRNHANADRMSMNSWIEGLLDVEDMRRRCQAHERWLQEHPAAVEFSAAWADRNLDDLTKR